MYFAIYAIAVFAGLAMTIREGLWSNTLTFFNVIICGLFAFGFYSPITTWLDVQLDGQWTYALDFIVVWVLFIVTMIICRAVAKAASRTRMRFRHPVDPIGGPIAGLLAAWVLSTFVMATLHMAPMPKDAFGGKLVYSTVADIDTASPVTAPDLGWLRFVQRMSQASSFGTSATDQFSAAGFVAAYLGHRSSFEKAETSMLRVRRG